LKHFQDPSISQIIEKKRFKFLNIAIEIYNKANKATNRENDLIKICTVNKSKENEHSNHQEESSSIELSEMSNLDHNKQLLRQSSSNNNNNLVNSEDEITEEWLHHYMFGKIKEKLNKSLMECLDHYRHSYEYLDKHNADYLKKITYKTKSYNYSIESNEIFYRIYTLTLKRIELIGLEPNNDDELKALKNFLEKVASSRFVKTHNDNQLEELGSFLENNVFCNSPIVQAMKNKEIFCKCVAICIAGLNQILKRFSQHYRSLYRLAYFYSKFLDFRVRF
jgi:hypothetical protein